MSSELLSRYYEAFHESRKKKGTVALGERLSFLQHEVGVGNKVIELGCRYGDLLSVFVNGNDVIGVDIDRNALDICQRRYGIETRVVNLNDALPFGDREFDVVVLSEVMEHLPYPSITLAEASRILKPDGKLVGSVPNAVKLRNRLRFLFSGQVEIDPTHLHHFSMQSLHKLLIEYFAQTKIIPINGKFHVLSKRLFCNYLLFSATLPLQKRITSASK